MIRCLYAFLIGVDSTGGACADGSAKNRRGCAAGPPLPPTAPGQPPKVRSAPPTPCLLEAERLRGRTQGCVETRRPLCLLPSVLLQHPQPALAVVGFEPDRS